MKRIAFFPGSFDPITKGHEDVIRRSINLFDEIIIGVGLNTEKKYMFTIKKRTSWIKKTFDDCHSIKTIYYDGMTIEACKKYNAKFILRGIRNSKDYQYEKNIAEINQNLYPEIETIYINAKPEFEAISSSIVKDIIKNQGNAEHFLGSGVQL